MVEIRKLGPQIGVEVSGVDVKTIDDAGFAPIYQAWLDHNVMCVRDQDADDPRFHPLQRALRPGDAAPVEIDAAPRASQDHDARHQQIRCRRARSRDEIYRRGAEGWHTDGAYNQAPFKATQLYALAVPSRGGNTLFANGYAAYDGAAAALEGPARRGRRRVRLWRAARQGAACSTPRTRIGPRSSTRSSAPIPRPGANRSISTPARSSVSSASSDRESDELIAELKDRMIAPERRVPPCLAEGRHRDLGQSLLLSSRRRRLPARGRPHPLARLDQRLRRRSAAKRRSNGDEQSKVHPFAAGCGADIGGVDIREPLSTADRDAIRTGMARQSRAALPRRADDRRAAHGVHPPVRRVGVQPRRA